MMFRQGDILLVRVDGEVPRGARVVEREGESVVLAYGEATGHRHRIQSRDADLYEVQAERFLRVRGPVELVHEEHATIQLRSGLYKIVRQREYVPSSKPREIAD
jgi:hypothetical protein